MAKPANRKAKPADAAGVGDGSTAPGPNGSALVTDADVARHAYHLYLARGRQPGRDVDDWLQAERELRGVVDPTQGNSLLPASPVVTGN